MASLISRLQRGKEASKPALSAGTSSRVLPAALGGYTVGVLVQSNLLAGATLTMNGAPVVQLERERKIITDTFKMVAYRAETAMANSLREHLKRPDEARRLLRALYTTEADLLPDPDAGTLTIFRGWGSLHRVSPVTGARSRLVAVLSYAEEPDLRMSAYTQKLFHGRAAD